MAMASGRAGQRQSSEVAAAAGAVGSSVDYKAAGEVAMLNQWVSLFV